jgi:hypothetical protein
MCGMTAQRSTRPRTLKRIFGKLGIEEQRLGLASEEGKLFSIPDGSPWIVRHGAKPFEPAAGLGTVTLRGEHRIQWRRLADGHGPRIRIWATTCITFQPAE